MITIYFLIDVGTNPCDTKNGGCEHKCTNDRGAAICSCESGLLNSDGKSCDGGNTHYHIKTHIIIF